jgi:hypothetical protein
LAKAKGLPEENEKLKAMLGPLQKDLEAEKNKNKDLADEN